MAAKKMMVPHPTSFHTDWATTRILKVSELPMALKPSTPTLLSRVATSPSPPTTCAQMEITITQDRKWGRYTTVCTKRRVASESRLLSRSEERRIGDEDKDMR